MVPFYLLFLLSCQFGHFLQEEAQCDYSTKSLKQPFSLLDCLLEGWERWIFYLSFYFDWCYCRVGRIRKQWWCGLLRVLNHEHLIIRVSFRVKKKKTILIWFGRLNGSAQLWQILSGWLVFFTWMWKRILYLRNRFLQLSREWKIIFNDFIFINMCFSCESQNLHKVKK